MDPFGWEDDYDDSIIEIDRLPHAAQVAINESKKNIMKDVGKIADILGVVGKNLNVIPSVTPNQHSERRPVRIGCHPVGGWVLARIASIAGAVVFAPALVSGSTFDTKGPPDPTYHWGVIVGDFYHELNTDKDFKNLYQNGRFRSDDWKTFDLGYTTFNDEAIRLAGEDVIDRMAKNDPRYDVLNNNCQLMAVNLLNQICEGAVPELFTSWKVLHLESPQILQKSPPAKEAVDIMLKNTPTMKKQAK